MYKNLLVATDASETAAKAVAVATDLAALSGATLHIAHVYKAGEALKVPSQSEYAEGIGRGDVAETTADSIAARARAKGVETRSHAVPGDPVDQILALAAEQDVDLIVVGNRGMQGARRVLGSVPNGVAHKAECAVLIVNTT